MANSVHSASRLKRYAYANQFGAKSAELQDAVLDIIKGTDSIATSQLKGTLISDVFQSLKTKNEDKNMRDEQGDNLLVTLFSLDLGDLQMHLPKNLMLM